MFCCCFGFLNAHINYYSLHHLTSASSAFYFEIDKNINYNLQISLQIKPSSMHTKSKIENNQQELKQIEIQKLDANKNSSKISSLCSLYIYKSHIKIVAHPYLWFATKICSPKTLQLQWTCYQDLVTHSHNNGVCLAIWQWLAQMKKITM